jgi:pimeloyl-ACP methyl ester carboxylesterase
MSAASPVRLVLLPGMDGTGDLFDPLIEAMGPHAAIDVVRYPGHQALGYEELESRVRAQLPSPAPFVLLGESFSGPLAISIAASPPPGLRGLVLCCSFARRPGPGLALMRAGLVDVSMRLLHSRLMRVPLRQLLLGRDASPRLSGMLEASLAQVSVAVMVRRMKEVQRVDVRDKLARVRVPALYLQALQDRVVPRQAAAAMQHRLSALRVVKIDGPHGLLQASPAASARAIESFCGELPLAFP